MTLERLYREVGGDLAGTVARLGGEERVERFLQLLAGDDTFAMLRAAMSAGDLTCAFRAAHTLKGVAANMGLLRMQEAASALTEALRAGDMDSARALYPAVESICCQVRDGIDLLDGAAAK